MKRKKIESEEDRFPKRKKAEFSPHVTDMLINVARVLSKEQFLVFEQYMENNRVRMDSYFISKP